MSDPTPIQQAGEAIRDKIKHFTIDTPWGPVAVFGATEHHFARAAFESIDRDRLAQVLMDHDAHTSGDGMTWDGPIGETDQTREHVRNAYRTQADAVLAWLRGEGKS